MEESRKGVENLFDHIVKLYDRETHKFITWSVIAFKFH